MDTSVEEIGDLCERDKVANVSWRNRVNNAEWRTVKGKGTHVCQLSPFLLIMSILSELTPPDRQRHTPQ
jgi:hypothetical protein